MPTTSSLTNLPRNATTEEVIVSEHLAELRGRVRLLTWISGLCWTAIVFLGGLLVSGTIDWLIHFDDSGTRLVIGLALAGGSSWILWRQLISPLRIPLTSAFLAGRMEQRFPGLKNRVLSAVEFLEHRLDARLGSTELQQAVVGQALQDLEQIKPSDIVQTNAVTNVTIAGTVVCAVTALIVMLHPMEAATSVERLLFPFASIPWPRAVELQLVRADLSPVLKSQDEPMRIARGDTLELYVRNIRGRLPERVWFEYRTSEDGPILREPLRQSTLRDDKGRSCETAAINWIAARGSLLFRASGGDDNVMPFHRVEVVTPPIIETLQVTVIPPRYSQRPVEILPPGVGHVQGLIGTKIEIAATSDKPLALAKLRIGEHPSLPLDVGEDHQRFTAAFEIKDAFSSSYWFELTDMQGFADREAIRYELRGMADGFPEVAIDTPIADVMLTADAELPVKILAKDDLGLNQVRIAYQVSDDEKFRSIPLFDKAENHASELPSAEKDSPLVQPMVGPQQHQADYVWKMTDLNLQPGAKIVFRGEATDDYGLGPAHLGKSIPRTITIVSGEEKQKELAARVGELLEDLQQATQLQQRARQQTQELQTQLEKVGELRTQDLDQLGRTELDQRQAASRLANPADGVETQARQLLEEFRDNHLNDAGTEQRLERLTNELGRLAREELPDAEQALTRAQKIAEQESHTEASKAGQPTRSGDPTTQKDRQPGSQQTEAAAQPTTSETPAGQKPEPSDSGAAEKSDQSNKTSPPEEKQLDSALAEALNQQTRSLETLNELQETLSEWRDRRDVNRDLSSVIAEQEAIEKDSSEMAQRTMSKSMPELTKQEQAELNKLSSRQKKVADQLEQFRKQLEQTAGSVEKHDPDSSEKFHEAGQELSKQATASKLMDAAQQIAENKLGSAAKAQQSAIEELHEVERMMKRQPNEDTEQFLSQTEDALQEFQQLHRDQQNLADQAQELVKQPESPEKKEQLRELMEQQEELSERMAKAEKKLERLRLRGPAEATHRARKRLNEMMKHLQEADDSEEMQQAMDEALDDLEQVERELVLEKRIAQERLAFEQLEKIEDGLKSLKSRQEAVIEETMRLEEAKADRETLTRGQLKTLKDLAETERSLQHDAEQMQQHMASAEVFSLVLKRLGRTLMIAADRLGERETAAPTQAVQREAIRRIDSLLAVLQKEQKQKAPPAQPAEKPEELGQEPQEQEEKPEEAQPPGDMIPQLAQLKLLKSLQEEYLERTQLLEQFRDKEGKLPESMETEQIELTREQMELADFARNLIAKFLQKQPDQKDRDEPVKKPKEDSKEPNPIKIDP